MNHRGRFIIDTNRTLEPAPPEIPLCVDLDGTLILTDLLAESVLGFARRYPSRSFLFLPLWLIRGKAYLKRRLATEVAIEFQLLPYNQPLLAYIVQERKRGRRICLITASDQILADGVAAELRVFDDVFGSDGRLNLKGSRKAELLVQRYGKGSFIYAGNSQADIPVWSIAKSAIFVDTPERLRRLVNDHISSERIFATASHRFGATIRSLRVHQWLKNLLLFVPLLGAHRWGEGAAWANAIEGFLSWCALSSAIYVTNDIIDLNADRAHPRKKTRPFASGKLSIAQGLTLAGCLAAMAVAIAIPHREFLPWLLLYAGVGVAYSAGIKRLAVLDALTLTFLYVLRLVGGGMVIDARVSPWLMAFATFFFLSLALLKRFSELGQMRLHSIDPGTQRRGYRLEDQQVLGMLGAVSGYMSILVMALYITAPEVVEHYSNPQWLWGVCPLLGYWITRTWLTAYRGEMHDDPVQYAATDVMTYPVIALLTMFTLLAV